ncbi:PotD/PotF family extracellular solute-binding protein [Erysipelothrix urinaevulpis]|uniref:ABC transporter substrate-binding protein n=1 Tax=Erysipelothrix urinaevulpis TaxID=2683717 RepID=UPI00135A44D4|nr:spermidine/putrescine ABC transporter substrate-binding protein [Erysipelothrix urinaevulpis]
MKKIGISLLVVLMLTACSPSKKAEDAINLMTWGGDFIPREVINAFEEESGIKVNYKEVASNEDMQSLLETSGAQYDLAVVTDYMVDILRQNDNILQLDHSKLGNLENINPNYQNNYYDEKNEYSIPYAISTALLLVNPKEVQNKGAKPITSYDDLWQSELNDSLVMIDGAVEVMGIVSKALGQEVNSADKNDIENVKNKLFELRPNIHRFETNTPEDSLLNKEAVAGFMYSNQIYKALEANQDLEAVFATEGTPIYIDSFVMSKQAPNPEGTYKFLNYMMQPEVAAKIAEITKFTTANKNAVDHLAPELKENPILNLSDEVSAKTFFYTNQAAILEDYDFIYSEFKLQ